MEITKAHLTQVYRMLPAAGAKYPQQLVALAVLVKLLDKESAAIRDALLGVDFTGMNVDDLTHCIVEWRALFHRIADLVRLCEDRLGAITNKRFRVDSGLGAIHLEVGQVISRAIARLFTLQNVQMAPELELDKFFK
jgi:hypothetical protein